MLQREKAEAELESTGVSVVISHNVVKKASWGAHPTKSYEDTNPCIISARACQAEGTATSKPRGQGHAWLFGRTPKKPV